MRSSSRFWFLGAAALSAHGAGCRTERATPAEPAAKGAAAPTSASSPSPPAESAEPVAALTPARVDVAAARAPELGAAKAVRPADDAPRIYAKTRFVWVYALPDASTQWIGFLRSGNSVRLRSTKPRAGPGCAAFYAIEPQGFVCGDGPRATTDANDAIYRALQPFATRSDSPWPHSYAESLGLVRYFSAPNLEMQKMREGDLRAHSRNLEQARAGNVPTALLGVDLSLPDKGPPEIPPLPITVFEDRKELGRRSTVAYSAEAKIGDRAFLLSGDFAWVPKDRVRPYPHVGFRGLRLGTDAELPLAFFRRDKRPKYRRDSAGAFLADESSTFARLAHVELTGQRVEHAGETYLETKEPGVFIKRSDAVVPEPAKKAPFADAADETASATATKRRKSWIEVSIEAGWLLAYEGTKPVYVTLISPGKGGAARPGEDPLERAASPVGRYPITGKFVTATMEAPGALIHSEVPFAQNVIGPYALHGAYWHDRWGHPESGGCINLSPIDAKWMFDFTDPPLPEGWHGVRWLPEQGPATVTVLHR